MKNNKRTPGKKTISRWGFIKNTALGAAGFFIIPEVCFGEVRLYGAK